MGDDVAGDDGAAAADGDTLLAVAVFRKRLAARMWAHWAATLPWGVLVAAVLHDPGILAPHRLGLAESVDCIAPFWTS